MRRRLAVTGIVVLGSTLLFAQSGDPFAAIQSGLATHADEVLRAANAPAVIPEPVAPTSDAPFEIASTPAQKRLVALQPVIDPILRQHGIPLELASVVLVESAGNPYALSPKGARGLWQLMPDTARRYGLVVNGTVDERINILKSTNAAARYLSDLYAQFGDWKLALAAYNAGEVAISRAIQVVGSSDFSSLVERHAIPAETRAYVPAVLQSAGLAGVALPVRRTGITFATYQLTP